MDALEECATSRHRMSLFANYRADRLIAEVKSSGNPAARWRKKHWKSWSAIGPSAIDPIVEALTTAEKKRDGGLRRGASQADRRQNPAASAQDHGRGQRSGDVGHRLGPVLQPQLPADRAARRAGQAGHAETGHPRRHHGAKGPLHGAGTVECRLQPGGQRARRAVQDHRRNRRRVLDRRPDRANRGQGSGRAAAHHQRAGTLQHPAGAAGHAEAAQGQQQVRSAPRRCRRSREWTGPSTCR